MKKTLVNRDMFMRMQVNYIMYVNMFKSNTAEKKYAIA